MRASVHAESVGASSLAVEKPARGLPSRVVFLMALAIFINYVDRGTLATAAPLIQDELKLSSTQMGILLSAFFWSYTPLQLPAGWIAQRMDIRYVYAGGLAIWSLATASTAVVSGFIALLFLRAWVGVGESVALPCNSQLLATGSPEQERGKANGWVSVGFGLGPAFGTLFGGLLMAHYGWRLAFLAFGLASLGWLWPWLSATRSTVIKGRADTYSISYLMILRQRAAWGASLGHFCSNFGIYFVLTWLPLYLVKAHGFSAQRMAIIGAGVYGVYAASGVLLGWMSDRLILAGKSVNRVRKSIIVSGMLGSAMCLFLCTNASALPSVMLLAAAAAFFGCVSPQQFAIAQTLAGPRAAGQWMGLENTIGNFAGILAPLLTGIVVDRTGQYFWAFSIVGAVLLLGAAAWGVIIERVEPVRWPRLAHE
jgi:MFS family permease